jgi:transposase
VGRDPRRVAGPQGRRGGDRLGAVRHRWVHRPGPPVGRRGVKKKWPGGEPEDHALGRSQGGFGTKLHLVAAVGGGKVLPLAVEVGPGQQHETQRVVPLVEALDQKGMLPAKLAGDKGYSAKWIRAYLLTKGVEPVIPHQKSEPGRAGPFDRAAYRERNLIERGINLLKWFRRVATRYEKLAVHYLGMLKLAILFRFYLD